jgi:hypothetical protein
MGLGLGTTSLLSRASDRPLRGTTDDRESVSEPLEVTAVSRIHGTRRIHEVTGGHEEDPFRCWSWLLELTATDDHRPPRSGADEPIAAVHQFECDVLSAHARMPEQSTGSYTRAYVRVTASVIGHQSEDERERTRPKEAFHGRRSCHI